MMSGPLVALFASQGEGTEEEHRRKEEMKTIGKELRAQREDNERRVVRERHRGGGGDDRRAHRNNTDEPLLCTSYSLCHCPSLHTHTHAITPTHSPSPQVALMDGHSSQTGVMVLVQNESPKSTDAKWIIRVLKAWKKERKIPICVSLGLSPSSICSFLSDSNISGFNITNNKLKTARYP